MYLPPHRYQELRDRLVHRLGRNQHHLALSQRFPRLLTLHQSRAHHWHQHLGHQMEMGCQLLQGPQHLQHQSILETVQGPQHLQGQSILETVQR